MKASELINAAIDELHSSADLATILLKIKTLAFLLKNGQLKEWANLELNGYKGEVEVPSYRRSYIPPYGMLLHVHYSYNGASQNNVLLPVEVLSEDMQTTICERQFAMSITEIEEWAKEENGATHEISNKFRSYLNHVLYKDNNSEWVLYKAWQNLSPPLFKGILLTVRSTLLDLLLELSEWDEVSLQSLQQKQAIDNTVSKALNSTVNIHGGNVNFSQGDGAVQAANSGDAAQLNTSGNDATQTLAPTQASDLRELVQQVKQAIAQDVAFDSHREEMEQEVERIEVQLQKPEPKKGIIKRAVESLQELAVKGAGIATGHAVYELLKQAPALLDAIN